MASLTDLSIHRPVATTMFYLVVVTVGIVGLLYLPVDLLPPIEFPRLTVYTRYANVGPEEIEQIIKESPDTPEVNRVYRQLISAGPLPRAR